MAHIEHQPQTRPSGSPLEGVRHVARRNRTVPYAYPSSAMGGFPKIKGTLLGVPKIRAIEFWGSILGSTI